MNTNGHIHFKDWDLFALGLLEHDEEQQMAAHLAGCDECRSVYDSAESLIATIGTLSPPAEWPAGAETRMRERLQRSPSPTAMPEQDRSRDIHTIHHAHPVQPSNQPVVISTPRRSRIMPWLVTAAALLLASGLAISRIALVKALDAQKQLTAQEHDRLQQSRAAADLLSDHAAARESASAALQSANAEQQQTIHQLQSQLRAALVSKSATEHALNAAQKDALQAEAHLQNLESRAKEATVRQAALEAALVTARQQLALVESETAQLREAATQQDHIVDLLQSASVSQLGLNPVAAARASARVYWKDDRGLLLVAHNLPAPPEHASYQLWFYRQGKPGLVSISPIHVDSHGDGLLFVPPGAPLLAMSGALVTLQTTSDQAGSPGVAILQARP